MKGILLIDKPKGWTSFDVVNYVRKMVAQAEGKKPKHVKVGHTGTLDPLATGLLVLLVGKEYTRRAGELSKLDKTYSVTMRFGKVSTTADEEGEKTVISSHQPTYAEVEKAMRQFVGQIMQTPPVFSAIKIDGQRAYKLARQGKEVKLEARPATIHRLELTEYEYPFAKFTADVSSGTYIRSLVENLGTCLKTGAYMSDLRRTVIGPYVLEGAASIEQLSTVDDLAELLRPL